MGSDYFAFAVQSAYDEFAGVVRHDVDAITVEADDPAIDAEHERMQAEANAVWVNDPRRI